MGQGVVRAAALTVVVAGVLALGAGVAGATVKRAPDHDTYVERADAICQRSVDKTDAVIEDLGFSPTDREARAATRKVVALARVELRQLRALTPPAADAQQVARIQATIEKAVDRIDRDPHLLVEESSPFTRATKLADAYGLEVCGRG
jgi:hypothetical protein